MIIIATCLSNLALDQWLQLPASDVEKLGRVEEGIQLPDGGYFGQLSVYHDLHCLVSYK